MSPHGERPDRRPFQAALAAACACAIMLGAAAYGRATPPHDAADADCRADRGWNVSCIRQAYQGPSSEWPRPHVDEGVAWRELAPVPPADADPAGWTAANAGQAQLVDDLRRPAVVDLGERLFFEPMLSRGGRVSCASCHRPERAFTDGKPLAVGEDGLMGRRRTMPLYGAPFAPSLFWDGRAATLAQQALAPIHDPREMNHAVGAALERLETMPPYLDLFANAFGQAASSDTPDAPDPQGVRGGTGITNTPGGAIDEDRLSRALAAYVATLRPPATRFDAFLGGDRDALSDSELLGLHLFRTRARCINCHNGPLLTDQRFHDIGLSFFGRRHQDLGRYEITRDPADLGLFRTPSLRGVSRAGPWTHNGLFRNLEGLLRMYSIGMAPDPQPAADGTPVPRKSPLIQPLELSEDDVEALLDFLEVL